MGQIILGFILLVGFAFTSFEVEAAEDESDEHIQQLSKIIDDHSPESLMQNFERVGGNPLAFHQAKCFFDKYGNNKFLDADTPKGIEIKNKKFVVITDLTIPSNRPRLFLLNLETRVVKAYMVAHGLGIPGAEVTLYEQGKINPKDLPNILFPKLVSNKPGSKATSRGAFILGDSYFGSFGYSLRQHGLQKDINDNVMKRLVVMHGLKGMNPFTVSSSDADQQPFPEGNLATSQGCSMLEPSQAKEVIDAAKGGSLYYIFSEQEKKLGSSYCADQNLQLK